MDRREWHAVFSPDREFCAGPYSKKSLAEKVLKIMRMAYDDKSIEIESDVLDPWAKELEAGLLPFKVFSVGFGKEWKTEVKLIWPPKAEGLIEKREEYVEWFWWARTTQEAKLKSACRKSNIGEAE